MKTYKVRTYSELSKLKTFEERYEYLKLDGTVSEETFGFDRYLNQKFYKSKEWINLRNYIITRDHGCDLGSLDHEIIGERILIHHLNPISKNDILDKTEYLLNPEYLITTTDKTHNAIHYGNIDLIKTSTYVERKKNDTCPWRH